MIRQFDVFPTPLRRDREERPYIVVVQASWINTGSRVCVPLVAERWLHPQGRLNPPFEIEGHRLYLHPVEIATFPVRVLRQAVGNLEDHRDRIVAALDLVFTGV